MCIPELEDGIILSVSAVAYKRYAENVMSAYGAMQTFRRVAYLWVYILWGRQSDIQDIAKALRRIMSLCRKVEKYDFERFPNICLSYAIYDTITTSKGQGKN